MSKKMLCNCTILGKPEHNNLKRIIITLNSNYEPRKQKNFLLKPNNDQEFLSPQCKRLSKPQSRINTKKVTS